ncbi:MAG: UDP-N-acetylmuramoyl-tripeptide--D-alanyl-D-alanine ligase [Candidatus Eisenbacteria bacterium]
MPRLRIDEIAGTVGAEVPSGSGEGLAATGYSIDTRHLRQGDLFFALKGETSDGHQFIGDAYEKGGVGAVVDRVTSGLPQSFPQLVVPSPLEALQRLAGHVRVGSDVPVVAITGSNGKTTTKEMIAFLLGTKMRVRKSPGNFNNHIGVPLSILALEATDRVLVIELGTNHRGEISELCRIARPQVGVITNIGRAHIGLLGSLEAIAAEKTDLARSLDAEGKAVINGDDQILIESLGDTRAQVTTFGMTRSAAFRASDVRMINGKGSVFKLKGLTITVKAPGLHNVYNALGAIAAASLFGVSLREAADALPGFESMRMKTAASAGVTIIDDTYNSNPDSVMAALSVLTGTKASRRIFIMGEMLELGDAAEALHREVGAAAARAGVDILIAVGGLTRKAAEGARAAGLNARNTIYFETKADLKRSLAHIIKPEDVVLVKASRMSGLEEISDFLRSNPIAGRI